MTPNKFDEMPRHWGWSEAPAAAERLVDALEGVLGGDVFDDDEDDVVVHLEDHDEDFDPPEEDDDTDSDTEVDNDYLPMEVDQDPQPGDHLGPAPQGPVVIDLTGDDVGDHVVIDLTGDDDRNSDGE